MMAFFKNISLARTVLIGILTVIIVSGSIFGFLWIDQKVNWFRTESEKLRERSIDAKKDLIKTEVDKAVEYVKYIRSTTETRLRESLKNRIYEAHDIAMNLYEKNRARMSDDELASLIREALRPIRFNHGRGYYFVTRLDGYEILYDVYPPLEGTNVLNFVSSDGKPFVKDLIAIARKDGEGFYSYKWSKPDSDEPLEKISFVKLFEPFDWYIGAGEYIADVEADIQKETLRWLVNIWFDNDGYLFGSYLNGDPLFSTGKITVGEGSLWDLTDSNGVKIIQEQRKVSLEPEGGFFEYSFNRPGGDKPSRKISFSRAIFDWEWMIGGGVYLDDIERAIEIRKQIMVDSIKTDLIKIVLAIISMALAGIVIARYVTHETRIGFNGFEAFFSNASNSLEPIQTDDLNFKEFKKLAAIANQMVAARRKSEAALRDSEQKYRNVVENTSEAITVIQADRFKFLNPAAINLIGYPDTETLNVSVKSCIHADDFQQVRDHETLRLNNGGAPAIMNFRVVNQEGQNRDVVAKAVSIHWEDKPAALVLMTDVTEQKRSQELMIQFEKVMSLGGLAAGMAHELNNPLSGMLQGIQNIERRLSPDLAANQELARENGIDLDKLRGYLEKRKILTTIQGVREAGKRASEIIWSMLQFARKSDSNRKPVDLKTLIDLVLDIAGKDYNLKEKYDFKNILIKKEFASDMPLVPVVEQEIVQVLLNIVKNAAYAVADKNKSNEAEIIIRLDQDDEFARIGIQDNGQGMDEKIRRHVFEPFFTTKPVGQGTGLGLSVSYTIVTNNHDGLIEVTSEAGKGTTFVVSLPLKQGTSSLRTDAKVTRLS